MGELWKDVDGFNGWYQVSNLGSVRSCDRLIDDGRLIKGKVLSQETSKDGYKRVALCRAGKHYKRFVHRLVAAAFVENPNNYPVINHIDQNRLNNVSSNLEWCTVKYNVNYGERAEKYSNKTHGELHYMHKLSNEDVTSIRSEYQFGKKGFGTESIAKKYGVHRMTVKAIVTGKTWKHLKGD